MVFCGNIVGKSYKYFYVALLGEMIACVYENQEVDAYLFMAVANVRRKVAISNLAAARAKGARHSDTAAALGGALVATPLWNSGSGAAPGGGRRPRPLVLGRGRGLVLHRLETPGGLGRGRGREVGKGGVGWLREGEVGEGRSGQWSEV